MAAALKLTAGQMVILSELHKNGRMRWSEFDNRDDVTELVERGLVDQVGGARLVLSERGARQAERLAAGANGANGAEHGNGNGNGKGAEVLLSVNQRDTLFRLHRGEEVRGKGVHFVLDSLRQHGLIRMGVSAWEPTALGMQRLIDAGLIQAGGAALPEPEDKREAVEVPPVAVATEPGEDAGDGSARVSLDDGRTFEDMAMDAALDAASVDLPDAPETTVLINGVQFTLPLALDLSDETVRERVMQAIEQALSPTEAAAEPEFQTADYFAEAAAGHMEGCDCLYRQALELLIERDERVGVFFERYGDYDAHKRLLADAARGVDAASDALLGRQS